MNKEDRGKKICFITVAHPMYGIGGAELQTYYYAKEFARQGWEVTFFTFTRNKVLHSFDNSHIQVVECQRSSLFILTWVRSFLSFYRIDSDIFFVRHQNFLLGLAGLFCWIKNRILIWSTMHDESCGRAPNRNVNMVNSPVKKAKLSIENLIFRYGVRQSRLILSQNIVQANIILDHHERESLIMYNSHPVDMKISSRNADKVIFVATMKEFKQPEIFCRIADELKPNNYQFDIIGRNYTDHQQASKLLEIMKISGCNYLGLKSPKEVNEHISKSKILINTSSSEGFPNTFVQAWINGVPVISLNVDPDDIIKERKLGFVCHGDIELCIRKIEILLKDKAVWNEISQNCLKFAHTKLDIRKNVELLSNKFQNMLDC